MSSGDLYRVINRDPALYFNILTRFACTVYNCKTGWTNKTVRSEIACSVLSIHGFCINRTIVCLQNCMLTCNRNESVICSIFPTKKWFIWPQKFIKKILGMLEWSVDATFPSTSVKHSFTQFIQKTHYTNKHGAIGGGKMMKKNYLVLNLIWINYNFFVKNIKKCFWIIIIEAV